VNEQEFKQICATHKRIAIVGGPRTGKTTLAKTCTDRPIHHNDDGKHLSWESQPEYWKSRVEGQDSFVIEGVQAARALRKGLQVDAVVELDKPHVELSKGQVAMSKGHKKIFGDVISANPFLKVYR
jgi:hypothetical protein